MSLLELFPARVPEPERMLGSKGERFSDWQATRSGRAWYAALATHLAERLVEAGLGPRPELLRGRVLSVGDGEGLLTRELGRLCPKLEILGTDLCPDMIARARAAEEIPENVAYAVSSVTDLEALAPVDAILCVACFHHFADPLIAVTSMAEALRLGGTLHLIDLRRDPEPKPYLRWLDRYLSSGELVKAGLFRDSVAAAYTPRELECLLTFHGDPRVQPLTLSSRARARYAAIDPYPPAQPPPAIELADRLLLEGSLTLC